MLEAKQRTAHTTQATSSFPAKRQNFLPKNQQKVPSLTSDLEIATILMQVTSSVMLSQNWMKDMELIPEYLASFRKVLRKKHVLAATEECYMRDVSYFAAWLKKTKGKVIFEGNDDVFRYIEHLERVQKESINSIRRKLISIKQFFRYIFNQELHQSSPVDEVPVPARDETLPDLLDHEQIQRMFEVLPKDAEEFKPRRDGAILSLLAFDGLKSREIIDLRWCDFLPSKNSGHIKVPGAKSRLIKLTPDSHHYLKSHRISLESIDKALVGASKPIFSGIKGRSGLPSDRKISRHGIKFMLYELGEITKVDHLNTELLRHYAIFYLLESGEDPETIREHFGLKQLGNIAKHVRNLPVTTDLEP